MDNFSKSSSYDDGEKREEQVRDHLIANEEAIKISVKNDSQVEKFANNGNSPKK